MSTRGVSTSLFQTSEESLAQNQVRPEIRTFILNGEKRTIRINLPVKFRNQMNPDLMNSWIAGHDDPTHRVALSHLMPKISYYNSSKFEKALKECTKNFLTSQMEGKPCYLLTQIGKSGSWVTSLATTLDNRFTFSFTSDLGIKAAQGFGKKIEDVKQNLFETSQEINTFLKKKELLDKFKSVLAEERGVPLSSIKMENDNSLETQLEELLNKYTTILKRYSSTFVIFDDSSYSGEQLFRHASEVKKHLLELQAYVKTHSIFSHERISEEIKINFLSPIEIKIVCPFLSSTAYSRLNELSVQLFFSKILPTIGSCLNKEDSETIAQLWGVNSLNLGSMYFDHKLPNADSFPRDIFRGNIPGKSPIHFLSPFNGDFHLEPYKFTESAFISPLPSPILGNSSSLNLLPEDNSSDGASETESPSTLGSLSQTSSQDSLLDSLTPSYPKMSNSSFTLSNCPPALLTSPLSNEESSRRVKVCHFPKPLPRTSSSGETEKDIARALSLHALSQSISGFYPSSRSPSRSLESKLSLLSSRRASKTLKPKDPSESEDSESSSSELSLAPKLKRSTSPSRTRPASFSPQAVSQSLTNLDPTESKGIYPLGISVDSCLDKIRETYLTQKDLHASFNKMGSLPLAPKRSTSPNRINPFSPKAVSQSLTTLYPNEPKEIYPLGMSVDSCLEKMRKTYLREKKTYNSLNKLAEKTDKGFTKNA
jgi:hypothetical protein